VVDLAKLRIDELIVHDVPLRLVSQKQGGPVLSDVPSELDDDIRAYFQSRLTQTIQRAASGVEHDPATSSSVPAEIVGIFVRSADFVARSQALATHLFNAQTGANPGDLLVIGRAQWDADRAVVVLKLEREEAVRLDQKRVAGGMTFDMAHLRNLMLGNRTRVFKAALFGPATSVSNLRGFVSDTQGGYGHEGEVAHFFLSNFLGCRLTEAPDFTTKLFLDVLDELVNTRVSDPARKATYRIAAVAALQNKNSRLSPRVFAADHLRGKDEQAFLDLARQRKLSLSPFDKDLRLVGARVERMGVRFANGIDVTGTAQSFDESVDFARTKDGKDDMHIRGEITKFK